MKRFMAKVLLAVCMVVLILSSAWAEKPIRILSLYPLSGPIKANSEQWSLGEKLAVEEANAQGGLLGRRIELVFEDSLLKPDVATGPEISAGRKGGYPYRGGIQCGHTPPGPGQTI